MKKISLLGMLLFLMGSVFAQTPHAEFGLKAGLNTI